MPRRKKTLQELAGSGDDGSTGLLGGGRTGKDDLRIETYGTADEASSALGLARALSVDERVREVVETLQRGLYRLGAELATNPGAAGRFVTTTPEDVSQLDRLMAELEAGARTPAARLLPAAVCRRGGGGSREARGGAGPGGRRLQRRGQPIPEPHEPAAVRPGPLRGGEGRQ